MKKTKIILFLILNLIFLEINTAYTSISNTIIANVGSEIITSYELKNKIRIVLFLTGQELSQIRWTREDNGIIDPSTFCKFREPKSAETCKSAPT